MVQRKKCRSRQELSNEYLLAKIGVDTAENEPLKVVRPPPIRTRKIFHTRTTVTRSSGPNFRRRVISAVWTATIARKDAFF